MMISLSIDHNFMHINSLCLCHSRYNHPEVVLYLIANAKFSDATNNDVLRWACQ